MLPRPGTPVSDDEGEDVNEDCPVPPVGDVVLVSVISTVLVWSGGGVLSGGSDWAGVWLLFGGGEFDCTGGGEGEAGGVCDVEGSGRGVVAGGV